MNPPRQRNDKAPPNVNPWSTAACALFQPDSFLCGAVNGLLVPGSPNHYGFPQTDMACGKGPNEEEQVKAAMRSLDQKFTPHMCEDREFFVIQNGMASVDAESLSTPSMGENAFSISSNNSASAKPVRDGVPSFEQDHILEAPLPMLMYKNKAEPETIRTKEISVPIISPPKLTPKLTPTKSKSSPKQIEAKIDEERLRKLLQLYPDPPTTQDDKPAGPGNSFIGQGIKSLVPSCASQQPSKSQQPKELMVQVVPPCGEMDEEMKEYWTEKFAEAANKVIQSNASRRCMEVVDPTIPRASDTNTSIPHQPITPTRSRSSGRQRYRKVLKKYRKHRVLVLILDPKTKLYEMLELPFRPDETTVADVLIMARIQTTDDRLRYQDYVGLCRPNLDPPPPPLSDYESKVGRLSATTIPTADTTRTQSNHVRNGTTTTRKGERTWPI